MPFDPKNALAIFSRIVVTAFKEFIHKLLEGYFDGWTVYDLIKDHIESLRLTLECFQQFHISLNLKKIIFCVRFCILLDHVVCEERILMDMVKISIIVKFAPPTLVKKMRTTKGIHAIIISLSGATLKSPPQWRSC